MVVTEWVGMVLYGFLCELWQWDVNGAASYCPPSFSQRQFVNKAVFAKHIFSVPFTLLCRLLSGHRNKQYASLNTAVNTLLTIAWLFYIVTFFIYFLIIQLNIYSSYQNSWQVKRVCHYYDVILKYCKSRYLYLLPCQLRLW